MEDASRNGLGEPHSLAVRLAVSADEGLARLRAYCCANGRPISTVAADIVAHRLSLRAQRDSGEGQGR
ncbi:hypothetical protein ACIO14_28620 [Nocardia fluminea]|uniref:hypothetical protein n=1 Tax=Nocardia fluminea TaxID=134984 RepID=UPI003805F92D